MRPVAFYCETPILKAERIGIGKLNNPAKRRVQYPAASPRNVSKACFGVGTRGSPIITPLAVAHDLLLLNQQTVNRIKVYVER
jgi:hypothetical protein